MEICLLRNRAQISQNKDQSGKWFIPEKAIRTSFFDTIRPAMTAAGRSAAMPAPDANVKTDNRCTRPPIPQEDRQDVWSQQRFGPSAMRWAKLILYLYIVQAAVGAAIGFVLPFL